MKIKKIQCNGMKIGYLYFYIHFITEVVSFYFLSKQTVIPMLFWIIPFIYDGLAFVPQSIIGYINDKCPKLNTGLMGIFFMFISTILYIINYKYIFISLSFLCLGNAFIHISGAEKTLNSSKGKLSPSAIFVAGGSFGVVSGKLLANTSISCLVIVPIILSMIPFVLLADTYNNCNDNCNQFKYVNKRINNFTVIILTMFIVAIRGYMGYGIPTSWNKTDFQMILLFSMMGIGKALGGVLSDKYGIRKIAIISTIIAIPFLCLGDNYMMISLIGVLFFSMTMSITLAMLVSILNKNPGLAFGLTTISLFLGTVPIFFVRMTSVLMNSLIITICSILCALIFKKMIRK